MYYHVYCKDIPLFRCFLLVVVFASSCCINFVWQVKIQRKKRDDDDAGTLACADTRFPNGFVIWGSWELVFLNTA